MHNDLSGRSVYAKDLTHWCYFLIQARSRKRESRHLISRTESKNLMVLVLLACTRYRVWVQDDKCAFFRPISHSSGEKPLSLCRKYPQMSSMPVLSEQSAMSVQNRHCGRPV